MSMTSWHVFRVKQKVKILIRKLDLKLVKDIGIILMFHKNILTSKFLSDPEILFLQQLQNKKDLSDC